MGEPRSDTPEGAELVTRKERLLKAPNLELHREHKARPKLLNRPSNCPR